AAQTVSFVVTTNNNALFSVVPAIDSSGTLTFTQAADRFGTATVTVKAVDNGGTAGGGDNDSDPQTFTITTTAVNDAPVLSIPSPNVTAGVNRGSVSTASFATTTAGPFETGQTPFAYTVTQVSTTNASLLSVAPAISSTGTLTYTIGENQTGSATFSVTVKDAGGTTNGGVDTSAATNFTITVSDGGAPTVPATPITITAYANIALSITAADGSAYQLLTGATDPENQLPLSVIITQKPTNSLVTVNDANGAFTFRSGDLTYTAGAIDPQSFKYRVCDSAANCSVERTVNVNFFTPLVFITDDDTTDVTGGLGTLDNPRKGLMTGFTLASGAPPATFIIRSGTYTTGTTGSATSQYLRAGDQVFGQGLAGLTWSSLGITAPAVGALPALPDLTTGTKPSITVKDPFPGQVSQDANLGALFVGLSGGTVKNISISKQNATVGGWILLATQPGFCCIGTPGIAGGNYVFDRITQTSGQTFIVAQDNATLTVSNSTIAATNGFAMSNGTLTVTNTQFTFTGTAGTHTAFIQSASNSLTQNLTLTVDATSSIAMTGQWDSIFRPEQYSNTLGWSTVQPLGSYTFDCPITITTTALDYPAMSIRGRTGMSIAFNGKVDLTASATQLLAISAESTGAGTLTMSNAANKFKTTSTTGFAWDNTAIQFNDIGIGAAGVNLSNLTIKTGNLSFTNTTGGPNGPISITNGTVNGTGAQPCVSRTNATNVTINPAVVFTNCS
ncbi:MAG TPA: Ig-like domain-containing protein, partial [Thermoanaerobaculia bacterium]|nr:Ig-like domain-containing protein [Thermoanaerobaculia bacterium]